MYFQEEFDPPSEDCQGNCIFKKTLTFQVRIFKETTFSKGILFSKYGFSREVHFQKEFDPTSEDFQGKCVFKRNLTLQLYFQKEFNPPSVLSKGI